MKLPTLKPDALLLDAVRMIEGSHRRMALVIDDNDTLLGTITDGDIRRCLLAGLGLEVSVVAAMNVDPLTAREDAAPSLLINLLRKRNVLALPLLDEQGKCKKIIHLTDLVGAEDTELNGPSFEFAVIMAGGEGTRLRPITQKIPKPMVEIGGVPLLQRQIENLIKAGIKRVYISVNYLGHVIEDFFLDGSNFGVEIRYLKERDKLGTAGALGLLSEIPKGPIVVMNGDILTKSDFQSLYNFHVTNDASLTMAAVDYRINIPYGVIKSDGIYATRLVEKPSQQFLCNAGIYAISPCALNLVKEAGYINMTDIIEKCLFLKMPVAVFPIHEFWSDIGTPDDLNKARIYFTSEN